MTIGEIFAFEHRRYREDNWYLLIIYKYQYILIVCDRTFCVPLTPYRGVIFSQN